MRYNICMDLEIKFLRHEIVVHGMPSRPIDYVFEIRGQEQRVRVAGQDREELCESGMKRIAASELIQPAQEWLRTQLRNGKSDLLLEMPGYFFREWKNVRFNSI